MTAVVQHSKKIMELNAPTKIHECPLSFNCFAGICCASQFYWFDHQTFCVDRGENEDNLDSRTHEAIIELTNELNKTLGVYPKNFLQQLISPVIFLTVVVTLVLVFSYNEEYVNLEWRTYLFECFIFLFIFSVIPELYARYRRAKNLKAAIVKFNEDVSYSVIRCYTWETFPSHKWPNLSIEYEWIICQSKRKHWKRDESHDISSSMVYGIVSWNGCGNLQHKCHTPRRKCLKRNNPPHKNDNATRLVKISHLRLKGRCSISTYLSNSRIILL